MPTASSWYQTLVRWAAFVVTREPASVKPVESSIFKEARESQRIAELARQGDELRAEKVKRVKEMIAKGKYEIDAKEVVKSILRAQPARRSEQNFYTASAGRTQSWIDGKSAGAHPRGAHAGFRVPLR